MSDGDRASALLFRSGSRFCARRRLCMLSPCALEPGTVDARTSYIACELTTPALHEFEQSERFARPSPPTLSAGEGASPSPLSGEGVSFASLRGRRLLRLSQEKASPSPLSGEGVSFASPRGEAARSAGEEAGRVDFLYAPRRLS
jgi:hypothetical protein